MFKKVNVVKMSIEFAEKNLPARIGKMKLIRKDILSNTNTENHEIAFGMGIKNL